jgi:hypothetical protein
MNGVGEPTYSQALAIRNQLFPTMEIEYLFASEAEKVVA